MTTGKPSGKYAQPPPDPKSGRNPGYPEAQPRSREEAQQPHQQQPQSPTKKS